VFCSRIILNELKIKPIRTSGPQEGDRLWHTTEHLDDGRGVLVPFDHPAAIAGATIHLLDSDAARNAMRKRV
jgi:hypothetical protein